MKRSKILGFVVITVCVLSLLAFSGCGSDESSDTIDEPDITVEYLEDEYAQQLTTDGADTVVGFVTLEENDDKYTAHISEKEIVASSEYTDGYYIADTNTSIDANLGSDARLTFIDGEAQVVTADEFIKKQSEHPEQLYTIYMMGDSAELILATEPETFLDD